VRFVPEPCAFEVDRPLGVTQIADGLNTFQSSRARGGEGRAQSEGNVPRSNRQRDRSLRAILPDPPGSAAAIAGQRERVVTIKR
jgi:hypothetical protein